jgi:hypothetical protein
MIAALYVQRGGCYWDLPDVDPWDEKRDARLYPGPHSVVAHPPCTRWGEMAKANQTRYGMMVGDDGGCFAAALASVRQWGGVLEHPAYTLAWPHHGLAKPPTGGGWIPADDHGGWTCCVAQRLYGHKLRKRTWLYAVRCVLPDLPRGDGPPPEAWFGSQKAPSIARGLPHLPKREASATPPAFRDALLAMARSVT